MAKQVEFNIHIKSGNDAIVDCPAIRIAEILEELAGRLRSGNGNRTIFDENGNRIGYMDFSVE